MRAVILFLSSILITAIFSYSLQVFLKQDYVTLTLQTLLIPCFTWVVLILSAARRFRQDRFIDYCTIAGFVCLAGSAVLVPAGVYNFTAARPDINYSLINVLICVLIMSLLFYVLLRRNEFSVKWWWAYNILICVNMVIFYWVAGMKII